ncbi:7-cyano-7-deazaguanine synthase QueC [Candidatus Altiarchaeota archaeon]
MGGESKGLKAVCLVSGGMDSCVCAAIAAKECDELYFLHLNYGHRTEERERKAFHDLAEYFEVSGVLEVDVSFLRKIGGSSLTDKGIDVPEADLSREEIPPTYVPFRNANILSIATSWAEVVGAGRIYFGAVEEDSSGYPDCRESFVSSFQQTIDEGTKPETKIEIVAPLIHLSKKEIVLKGKELNAPFELTWSCYQSNGPKACGICDSCALRKKGFKEAGSVDPVEYER